MTCNRIITGASFDVAALDAFIEPIINGFWFYFLLVFLKEMIIKKISFIGSSKIGIYLAVIYAMTCNRLLTGAPLNLAAADALIEPIIIGFWFYLLFEVFNIYKVRVQSTASGRSSKNPNPSNFNSKKLSPINNKKNFD